MRVIDQNSRLSYLQQRLNYAYKHFSDPLNISENVPVWPQDSIFSISHQEESPDIFQHYLNSQGSELLINNIKIVERRKYGINIDSANILVSNGALHGLSLILRTFKFSKVLCQKPVFASIPELMKNAGYFVEYFDLKDDIDKIERLILSGKHDFIYLNIPNNPMGDLCSAEKFDSILKLAESYNIKILLDMVYDAYIEDENYLKFLFHNFIDLKNVYIVNSVSKAYGAPGLRVGWIISNPKNIQYLQCFLEKECICVSASSQALAVYFLQNGNKILVDRVKEGRKNINNYFHGQKAIILNNPLGGVCFLADFDTSNIEEFIDFMLLEYKVVLASSSNYVGLDKNNVFRIPMGHSEDILYEAFERIFDGATRWIGSQNRIVA